MTYRREFRDDDAGYLFWVDTHPDGYVVNIARSHNTPTRVCTMAVAGRSTVRAHAAARGPDRT